MKQIDNKAIFSKIIVIVLFQKPFLRKDFVETLFSINSSFALNVRLPNYKEKLSDSCSEVKALHRVTDCRPMRYFIRRSPPLKTWLVSSVRLVTFERVIMRSPPLKKSFFEIRLSFGQSNFPQHAGERHPRFGAV